MDGIRAFELKEMAYTLNNCTVCHERRLEMPMFQKTGVCRRCHFDKSNIKMFSNENNMNPGQVLVQLQNLSVVEQQLMCRLSPCINVHMLSHGGVGSSGHCVSFSQEVDEPAQIFPLLPEEINVIKMRKKRRNNTSKEFTFPEKQCRVCIALVKRQ